MTKVRLQKLRGKLHVKHGWSFKGEHFADAGDYILLTPGNFQDGGGFKFDPEKAKYYAGEFPEEYLCAKGDLVVVLTEQTPGLLGCAAFVPEDGRFLHNQRIGLVAVDERLLDKTFTYYLFNTKGVGKQLRASSSGSKVKHTSPDRIYDVLAPIPELDEQKRIASVLSALDAKITLNQRINAELEAMAKLLYDYWFLQFDFPLSAAQAKRLGKPSLEGKPYKSSGGPMVYNAELKREVPEGWEVDMVGTKIRTCLGGTPSPKEEVYWKDGSIHWLNSGEVAEFPVVSSEAKITSAAIEASATELMPKGTVVMSITRHLRPSILAIEACANQSVVGLYESDRLKRSYLYPYMVNEVPRFMALRTGAQQPHINKETVDVSWIVLPPGDIMDAYYAAVDTMYDLIDCNALENQELASLRDWLLPLLMNGQVRVAEAEEKLGLAMAAEPQAHYGKQLE